MCRLCLARLLCCLLSCLAGLPLQHAQSYQVYLQHLNATPCVSRATCLPKLQADPSDQIRLNVLVCFAGGWWRARQEMSNLCANYDSSTTGDALLRALIACGALDVAHSLSESRSSTQVCLPYLECTSGIPS